MSKELISHTFNSIIIAQRQQDGYINLTAMCKACGKQLGHYLENASTKAFLEALSRDTGISINLLVQTVRDPFRGIYGSFGHPYVAAHLGQWLSPDFAVQVSKWVVDWFRTGVNPVQVSASPSTEFEREVAFFKLSIEVLRPSEASTIGMLTRFGKIHHCNMGFLPEYTEERLTKSLTEQLQAHGSSLSAIKANQVLLALGIIEEQSRPSSKGTRKFFKVLTEEGLQYGKNLISEKNERETQPHYYTDTFLELLDKINQWLEQQK